MGANGGSGLEVRQLAVLGDALADIVVVTGRDGRIRWANRAAEQLFGEPWEAWAGRSGMDIVHPDDLAMSLLSLDSVQAKQAGTPIDVRLRTPGGWRLMESSAATSMTSTPCSRCATSPSVGGGRSPVTTSPGFVPSRRDADSGP